MRVLITFCLITLVLPLTWADDAPLHRRIDELVLKTAAGKSPAARADDAEFCRRAWLDFAGRIPTAQATREFLANSAADKRQKLIDDLLAAPTYPDRMADQFHVLLMERRGENADWKTYLKTSFAANKSWDQLAREVLNPDAENAEVRAAGFFLSKRLENYGQNPIDYPGLTRDVARLFMGQDLQCAECHNHLFIEDYKQHDFQGLFAVYKNTFVRRDVSFPAVGEKAMPGKLEFVSVFDPTKRETGPRVPGGKEFDVPEAAKLSPAEEKKRAKNPPPRPDFSGVELLAKEVANPENRQFAKNAANRVWFLMLGRGIVHPLDMHHSANKPSQPELLDLLATELAAHRFDLKWLLREIALSETYQRSSQQLDAAKSSDPGLFLVAHERRLSAEQILASVLQVSGEADRPAASASEKPELATADQLRKGFVDALANDARDPEESVSATVKAALFWRNDNLVQQLLKRRAGNFIDRLMTQTDDATVVDDLYVSILSRRPTAEEQAELAAFLKRFPDAREATIRDSVWALLTSIEFAVNH